MATVKSKLSDALDFDKSMVNIKRLHISSKMMNVKHVIPTYSTNGVFSCQFSPVSDHLVMGYGNGDAEVFNSESGEQVMQIQNISKDLPVTSIRFLNDSAVFLATGPNGRVRQINLREQTNDLVIKTDNEISCIDVNKDNSFLSIVGKKPDLYLYDAATYELLSTFEGTKGIDDLSDDIQVGHSQRLFVTKFDPIDKFLVLSAGWDCSVKLWDTRTNSVAWTVNGPKVCGEGIDISGNYLLTASWIVKDALQLWDTRTQKMVSTLNCRTNESSEFLYCGQFYSNDKVLCGGSGVTNVKLLDTSKNEVIDEVVTNLKVMQSMCVSRTKKILAVAGLGENATCATFK